MRSFLDGVWEATGGNVWNSVKYFSRAIAKTLGGSLAAGGEALKNSGDLGRTGRREIWSSAEPHLNEGLASATMELANGTVQIPMRLVRGSVRALLAPFGVHLQPFKWELGNPML